MELTLMFAITTVMLAVAFVHSDILRKRAEYKRESYRSLYEGALDAAVNFSVELSEARDKLEDAPQQGFTQPSINQALEDARTSDDPIWHFAEVNRDLMPMWELHNPHIAAARAERRYSDWATFCANLTVMSRDCLEVTLTEMERGTGT